MSKRLNIKKVLDNKVKQSIAGYKSNYAKSIKNARNESERKALINAYPKFIANVSTRVVNQVKLDLAKWIDALVDNQVNQDSTECQK